MSVPQGVAKPTHRYTGKFGRADDNVDYLIEFTAKKSDLRSGNVYWVDFRAWEITSESDSGPEFGGCEDDGPRGDYVSVPPTFEGFLKWDGCNEIEWEEADHCCGLEGRWHRFATAHKTLVTANHLLNGRTDTYLGTLEELTDD